MSLALSPKAHVITFDIETYRSTRPSVISRIREEAFEKEPNKTATKAAKTEWYTEEARQARMDEALSKTAVDQLLAEVLCVQVGCSENGQSQEISSFFLDYEAFDFSDDSQHADQEEEMLVALAEFLSEVSNAETIWVGHNITGFDLPILLNRWRYFGITPPQHFPSFVDGRFRGRIYDTMKRAPGKNPYLSMEVLCEAYGVTLRDVEWRGAPMHGGRCAACAEAGDWPVLLEYCREDVISTFELYKQMTFGSRWGTYPPASDLVERLEAIEHEAGLSEAQKALTQKTLLKNAGVWPR